LTLTLKKDYRLGGNLRYVLAEEDDDLMQIPDEIRKCVVFVCFKDTGGIKLAGTAFLFGIPVGDTDSFFATYFITAKHVIDGIRNKSIDQNVYLRINLKTSGVQIIETPIGRWLSHPLEQNVDVSALNWSPPEEIFDYRIIMLNMAATGTAIEKENIGIGDDVFLTGLFRNHYGSERNIPVIRVGNIAAMPEEKVHTEKLGDIDAYLIEARSIGGLSGSPVFVQLGLTRYIDGSVKTLKGGGYKFYLLGLMHGHFDLEYAELDNIKEDNLYNFQVNMGIAIVVPIWKILEVINQETFVNMRKLSLEYELSKKLPTPDTTNNTDTTASN